MLEKIKQLENQVRTDKVCLSLDWLSIYFTDYNNFFGREFDKDRLDEIILRDNFVLQEVNAPTTHFTRHFLAFMDGVEVAHILCASRNEKFFSRDTIKVEFVNHTLYSGVWLEVYEIIKAHYQYKGMSRLDIAIDGVNYMPKLLNIYAKQTADNILIKLKNSNLRRSRFNAKVLCSRTFEFQNFNIGNQGANKMITVYNKSLEIVRSGKQYIEDYWVKNGITENRLDIAYWSNRIDDIEKHGIEVFKLDNIQNIFRFEIRLKAEAIKEIKDFHPDMLSNLNYLASIVKLHTRNYFEMYYNDDSNVSRCTHFPLLDFSQLEANVFLERIDRVEKDGEYKAKMTMHGLVADVYKNIITPDRYEDTKAMIMDRVEQYNLSDWLHKKLQEWQNKYLAFTRDDRIYIVSRLMAELSNLNTHFKAEKIKLAIRNNQNINTANFGE